MPRSAPAIGLAVCVFGLADCVRVPDADDLAQGPQVDEIVRRVKCDLYDAMQDPLNAPYGYEWLHDWTAQANLNLIVNDQSQFTPGATITEPLRAVTIPQKVTNFAQSFNLGLGAAWNNTATRNEIITFTVSLEELMEQSAKYRRDCDFPNFIDLRSELGLKDWIAASLSPVREGDLSVGYHKSPKTGSAASAATAKAALTSGQDAITQAMKHYPPPKGVSIDCDVPSTIPKRSSGPPSLAALSHDLPVALCELGRFFKAPAQGGIDLSVSLDGAQVKFIAQTIKDIDRAIADLMYMNNATGQNTREALKRTAINLSIFVDPPIDTLSHQVQFVVVCNVSATPSWTLVHFKGPGASGSLFSAIKTRTHTLNIVLGPPSSLDSQGALNALQIGTAVGNALITGAAPVP